MAKVLITQAAEDDYTQSLQWYAERSQWAAEGFEAEFASALQSIAADPERYPFCDQEHQFYLLKRYPFQVIYRQAALDRLLIVAVAHTSRRPGYWSER